MISGEAAHRASRNSARVSGAWIPETMARMMRIPVTPVMSVTTWSCCTFICMSALLDVLNVGGGVVHKAFAMAQVGAQPEHPVAGPEAAPEQAIFMELLEPLRIVHVALSAWDMLDVARVHQERFRTLGLRVPRRRESSTPQSIPWPPS